MGCPVRKVCKTGAGAALLDDHDRAVAIATAAREGSGLPVTVKLRSGQRPGERNGVTLARRLVDEAGVRASPSTRGTPRSSTGHARLRARARAGGGARRSRDHLGRPGRRRAGPRAPSSATGADAVMLARGSFGNPWLFERLLGLREGEPTREEIATELRWVIERAEEHLGVERAGRYLRKFYPWYAETLGLTKREQQPLVTAPHDRACRADDRSAPARCSARPAGLDPVATLARSLGPHRRVFLWPRTQSSHPKASKT